MATKLPRSIKKLPRYKDGFQLLSEDGSQFGEDVGGNAGVSAGLGLASTTVSMLPDKKVVDAQGNFIGSRQSVGETVASQALKGAAAGAMFGPWGAAGGAAIYGALGAIQAGKEKRELERAKRKSDMLFNRSQYFEGDALTNQMSGNVQTNTKSFYAYGGAKRSISQFVNEGIGVPNAEIETDELVQTDHYPQAFDGGKLKSLNSVMYEADGQTHEETNANGVSGIETSLPEGSRIFSDRIKHNGRTIASIVSPISKKIGKLEERAEIAPSKALLNTIDLLKNQEDFYFAKQEEIKKDKEAARTLQTFMKGGYKYC